MGLDLALGGIVLIAALRGWLKGFVVQAIRLAGLVAAVYSAVPVREYVKPYVASQLPTLRPELLDRMLWWGSAVLSYVVIVGVASLIVAVARRPRFGIDEPNRGDQFAGFWLGVAKGLVSASFLVAGLERYALPQIARISWAEEQRTTSVAWDWNAKYHPAEKIWAAPPVQQFVGHIQRMGLKGATSPEVVAEPEPVKAAQTASRTPKLAFPAPGSGIDTTGLDADVAAQVEAIERQLKVLETAK